MNTTEMFQDNENWRSYPVEKILSRYKTRDNDHDTQTHQNYFNSLLWKTMTMVVGFDDDDDVKVVK